MADVFCTKCGNRVSDSATICPSCGTHRTAAAGPIASPAAHAPSPAQAVSRSGGAGFFAILLDTSFSEFITLKLIKFIYILGCIAVALAALSFGLSGFSTHVGYFGYSEGSLVRGLSGTLIGAPIMFFVLVTFLRVMLEFISAVFRIAENTSGMAKALERR